MTGIEVGVAVIIGVLIGRFLPNRRKTPDAGPACGCKHHLSYHDPKTGRCSGRVPDGIFGFIGDTSACTCKQYSGPQPLPDFYAPEIGG